MNQKSIDDHDNLIRKINAAYLRLPPSTEKVQFSKLTTALRNIYLRYDHAKHEHRLRPSPEKQAKMDLIAAEYDRLHEDIVLSLTIASICL